MRVKIRLKDYILIIENANSIEYDDVSFRYIIKTNKGIHRIYKNEVELMQIV